MGGVAQVKYDEHSAWTRDKPNHDQTGLDPGTYRAPIESTQYCPIRDTSGLEDCSTSFSTSFSIRDDLCNFQKNFFGDWKGMAWTPLGYLPDSASPIVMV